MYILNLKVFDFFISLIVGREEQFHSNHLQAFFGKHYAFDCNYLSAIAV